MADGEAVASALAARCGFEVEVSDEAMPFGGVYANPDGTFTMRSGVEPFRARDEQGTWAPIDTTLHVRPDGVIEAVNTVVAVEFSPGGDRPFATMIQDGKSFGLTWPGLLPAPTVSGETATYADVFPDVDLVVHAQPEGFRHDFVVHTPEAAADPRLTRIRLGFVGDGLALSTAGGGGLTVTDAATGDEFASTPTPMMWDSPPAAAPQGFAASAVPERRFAPVGVEASNDDLTLIPDQSLLTGPDTIYPVVIDPPWNGGLRGGDWASAWSQYPTNLGWKGVDPALGNGSTYGNAGAGQTCDNWTGLTCTTSTYKIRSFFRMDTEGVTRRDDRALLSANFKILQRHAANCNVGKAKIWHTDQIKSSHDWNNQPTFRAETAYSKSNANHGVNCDGGPKYAEFDVLNMAKVAKANKWYSFTIGMRAADESPSPDLNEWRRYDSGTAILELTYNTLPQSPNSTSTDGKGCANTQPGPWTTTLTPRLTATPRDGDGGTVTTRWRLRDAVSSTLIKEWITSSTANKPVTTAIPAGALTGDGDYKWHASTEDAHTGSGYSAYCYFQVDTDPPTTPTATLLTDDPIVGQPVKFRLDGPTDASAFAYALTGGAKTSVPATNGTAEISPTPTKTNLNHVLQVWAKDAAGNESPQRFDLPFDTRLPSQISFWPLAGDGVDDIGAHDLTLPPGATWVTDSFGKSGSAMHLDKSGCASTSGAVLNTTKSFTVSLWARPSNTTWNYVLGQRNEETGGFWFNAETMSDGKIRWWASMLGRDPRDGALRNQSDATDAVFSPDTWQHVTVAYNAEANAMTLYVNGASQFVRTGLYPRTAAKDTTPLYVGCSSATPSASSFGGGVHDVRVFDGAVTPEQAGAVAAKPVSLWTLNETGVDSVAGNNLTFQGTPAWDDDRNNYPNFAYALALGGNGYAQSAATGVRTDNSFTVAAWVKLTDKSKNHVLVSQAATNRSSFYINYVASADRWQFSMPSADTSTVTWHDARALDSPELNSWYHLAGVYDASRGKIRFYVNGELQGEADAPSVPWHVEGPLLVGAAGSTAGNRWDYMIGAIDDVRLYAGVIDDDRLADISCSYASLCGSA